MLLTGWFISKEGVARFSLPSMLLTFTSLSLHSLSHNLLFFNAVLSICLWLQDHRSFCISSFHVFLRCCCSNFVLSFAEPTTITRFACDAIMERERERERQRIIERRKREKKECVCNQDEHECQRAVTLDPETWATPKKVVGMLVIDFLVPLN